MTVSIQSDGLLPGFEDPVRDAQRSFRAVLEAMAHPGKIVVLSGAPAAPAPLAPAAAALCLALVDGETPLWLDEAARSEAVSSYLRFHCGVPLVPSPYNASFAVVADAREMPSLDDFDSGSSEFPERSTTLLLQVEALHAGHGWRLSGPGIEHHAQLHVEGLNSAFAAAWKRNHALFPCGVDVVFVAGNRLAALPRTTLIEE